MGRSLPIDYPVRNLGRRPARTLLTALACALVTGVLAAAVAFARGLESAFRDQGRADTTILLSAAAMRDLVRSAIAPAVADLVAADVEGVLRVHGVPAISPEIHMGTKLRLGRAAEGDEVERSAFVRGVTERAFLVHERVTLVEGQLAGPGEVIVGALVARALGVDPLRLAPGAIVRFEGAEWRVAGIFATPGTTIEAEIWAPLFELEGRARREDVSAVFVRLADPADLDLVDVFAQRRLDLELVAIPSREYYAELAAYFGPVRSLAWAMACLVAVSVLVTGAGTLVSAVQDRTRELATLRALGFSSLALVRSLAIEALLLSSGGGLLGLFAALAIVRGLTFRIGMGALELSVDSAAILVAFVGVLALGLLGSLPAAARVLRLPVADALSAEG